jgi:DNA processing protein
MTADEGDRRARHGLMLAAEPGNARLLELVEEDGAAFVEERLRSGRLHGPGLAPVADRLTAGLDIDTQNRMAAAVGARLLCPGDADWPTAIDVLAEVTDGDGQGGRPLGLWVRGGPLAGIGPAVAVVGSRAATDYGAWVAADLAADLAGQGVVVVSGGAYGIDGHAHRGALVAGGVTVAVLACGVDVAYPRQHEQLFERIVDGGGALVSEAPMGATARRNRFLVRNRLIAALSLGTVVVEAAARSGALNTANWADRCSRPTFAVPGPVGSALSAGTHRLVRERGAVLVTCAGDVLEDLGLAGSAGLGPTEQDQPTLLVGGVAELSLDASQVLAAMREHRAADVAGLSRASALAVPEVLAAVAELALAGLADTDGAGYRVTGTGRSYTASTSDLR